MRRRPFLAALIVCLLACAVPAWAQPAVRAGVVLSDSARAVLTEIMQEAGVASAVVTSARRTPAAQVQAMLGYIRRHGIRAARALYGLEGNAVIDVYEAYRGRAVVADSMRAELMRQLPAAFANRRLMHLHPCYDTFDVSMRSIPERLHEAFSRAARAHPQVHRFLGRGEAEREAFHIEVRRPGPCTVALP